MNPKPTKEEQEIIDLTKTVFDAAGTRSPDSLKYYLSFFHNDATGFGTGLHEMWHNKKMIEENERKGIESITDPIEFEYLFVSANIFEKSGVCRCLVNFKMYHDGQEIPMNNIRISIFWAKENDTWKVIHMHTSLPYTEQQEGDWVPLKELKARNQELKRLVEERTEELQIAKEDAEAANEAKSIFLSTVSHELRTPLTSIIGFTQLNKKSLDGKVIPAIDENNQKAQKSAYRISDNLEVVKSESERLLNIINDLLDLSKIESGKVEWKIQSVDPNQLIERAVLATSSLFEENPNLKLVKKNLPKAPTIQVDKDRILQVLINLLSNAIKFSEEGQITISLDYLPFPIISGASRHQKHLVFRVEDTGLGIPDTHIDTIFDRFQQVGDHHTEKPQGTGLGLAICKEIVEHHKGKIWVESEVGKGSVFAFIVPY